MQTSGNGAGALQEISIEMIRTNDVLAYAVGDVVSTDPATPQIIQFPNAGITQFGPGYITKARLLTNLSTCVAAFRLWIYEAPITMVGDNVPMPIKYADGAARAGWIDFPAMVTEQAGSDAAYSAVFSGLRMAYVSDKSQQLYAVLQTKTVFTPAALQKFWVELTCEQF